MEITKQPPSHMKIVNGQLLMDKKSKPETNEFCTLWASECHLCMNTIHNVERSRIGCINPRCKLTCHIICLADHCLTSDKRNHGQYIPIDGECPLCDTYFTWAALLHSRFARNGQIEENESSDDGSEIDIEQHCNSNSESEDCEIID